MTKLIEFDEARKLLKSKVHRFVVADEQDCNGEVKYYEEVINAETVDSTLASMPAVDAKNANNGTWETDSDGLPVCSACGGTALQRLHLAIPSIVADIRLVKSPYCPWCGFYLEGNERD